MKFTKFTNAMHKEEGGTRESLHSARAEKKKRAFARTKSILSSPREAASKTRLSNPELLRVFQLHRSQQGPPGGRQREQSEKASLLVPQSRPGEGEARGGRRPLVLDSGSRRQEARRGGERRLSLSFFFSSLPGNREEGVCVVLLSSRAGSGRARRVI